MSSDAQVPVAGRRLVLQVWLWSSLIGVSIWHVRRLVEAPVSEWLTETIITLSYFTNLTNILIVVMAWALLRGRGRLAEFFAAPSVQAACSLYILFVGLAFWFVLGGPQDVEAWWLWIPEATAHTLSPLLGVVWWARYVPWGAVRPVQPVVWLGYPIAYLGYWLVRGPIVGEYPYFFIDVNELGYDGVAVWSGILIAGFLVLGGMMLGVDRVAVRRAAVAGRD